MSVSQKAEAVAEGMCAVYLLETQSQESKSRLQGVWGGQGERSRAGKKAHTKFLIKLVPTVLSRNLERQKEETLSTGTHLPLDKDS